MAPRSTELGVFITHANRVLGDDLSGLVDTARAIERAGADYVVVADHVVLGTTRDSHGALANPLPYPQDEPYPEPLVTLAAIAAVTSQLRLATGILIAPLRPPALLAKSAATLAALSQGRLDLGVGTGWHDEEFAALGTRLEDKVQRLDDAIEICRLLWSGEPVSFEAPSVTFSGVVCSPVPPGGSVPLWFAGRPIAPTLRRVLRYGVGWLPLGPVAPEVLAGVRKRVRELGEAEGRTGDEIGIRVSLPTVRLASGRGDPVATAAAATALVDAGATGVQINLRDFATTPEEAGEAVADIRARL